MANTKGLTGEKVYLNILDNNGVFPIKEDSLIVNDNNAVFTGQLMQLCNFASLLVKSKNKYISVKFIIDTGTTKLNLSYADNHLDILNLVSKSNQINNELIILFNKYSNDYAQKTGIKPPFALPSSLNRKILFAQTELLKQYPDDYFSVLYLNFLSHFDSTEEYANLILKSLASFGSKNQNTTLGQQIYKEKTDQIDNLNKAKTGKQVINFSVPDINNKIFNNNSLLGRNYLIVFSATWCIPCQYQLPKLKQLYENYKSKGLIVVYFNNDDNVKKWKAHVQKNKLSWINVSERLKPSQSKIQKSFAIYAVPTCLLIDKTGKIVYNSNETDTELTELEANVKRLLLIP